MLSTDTHPDNENQSKTRHQSQSMIMTNAHDMPPLCDLSTLDKAMGEPNLQEINHAVTQISTTLTPLPCDTPKAKEHGCAWTIVNKTQWLMKNGVDAPVPPAHPGPCTGTTHTTKFACEQKLKTVSYTHLTLPTICSV